MAAKLSNLSNEVISKICTFTPTSDLANLSQTCHLIHDNATRVLYMRNALEEDSSAIPHLVELGCRKPRYSAKAMKALDQAFLYGGDPNAEQRDGVGTIAALAIAAAYGNVAWARKLCDHGADLKKESYSHFSDLAFPGFKRRLAQRDCPLKMPNFEYERWLPLCIPMLLNKKDMVDFLIERGAPAELARSNAPRVPNQQPWLTVHHVCAVDNRMGLGESLVTRFAASVSVKMESGSRSWYDGCTPLHVAILTRNTPMFDALICAHADINARGSEYGFAPIHLAISECATACTADERRLLRDYVFRLVEEGADLNRTATYTSYTPIMTLMDSASLNWDRCSRDMRQILDRLVKKGANANYMTPHGQTCAIVLARRIGFMGLKASPSLTRLVKELVTDHKVELNHQRSQRSLLGDLFMTLGSSDSAEAPTNLITQVVKLGAVLHRTEANRFFPRWAVDCQFRRLYDMSQHKNDISSGVVFNAYLGAIRDQDVKRFDIL